MTQLQTLIEARLNDSEVKGEVRQAARQYYHELVEEDRQLNETVDLNKSVSSNEAMVLGFIEGYRSCLGSHQS